MPRVSQNVLSKISQIRMNSGVRCSSLVALVLAGAALTGCQQNVAGDDGCKQIDWQAKGLEDGSAGRHFKVLDTYARQCGGNFNKKSEQLWTKGYLDGMKTFCTEINGFRDGQTAETMINTCPKDSEYFAGYKRGHQAYMDERERREVEILTRPEPDNGMRAGRGSDL